MSLGLRAFTIAAVVVLAGCATSPMTIADTAARTPQLSTLNRLMQDAGLAETLRSGGPFTVFAPTDEAFKAVPAKTMEQLGNDKEALRGVLSYHVVAGRMTAAELQAGNAKTVQGSSLAFARSGTFVTVEEALVTQADVMASNGVVHVIDRVLLPPAKR